MKLAFTVTSMTVFVILVSTGRQIPQAPTEGSFTFKAGKVEAKQVQRWNLDATAKWCKGKAFDMLGYLTPLPAIRVPVYGGTVEASYPDWIVRDEDGRFEVYSVRDFWKKYHHDMK